MDRYQRVPVPREPEEHAENEVRITSQGKSRIYISLGASLLTEKDHPSVVLKAMGKAISKTVTIAEIIKRRVVGLHQDTAISSVELKDHWEPKEEGLDPIETTRHVSVITITLSKEAIDTASTGYQEPLPESEVQPLLEDDEEHLAGEADGEGEEGGGYRRGRGGRGRGRRRGAPRTEEPAADAAAAGGGEGSSGRGGGRGGRWRGRGRGGRGRGEQGAPAAAAAAEGAAAAATPAAAAEPAAAPPAAAPAAAAKGTAE